MAELVNETPPISDSETPANINVLTVDDLDYYTSVIAKKINDLNYVVWYLINNGVFHEPLPENISEYIVNPENQNTDNTKEV